MQTIMNFKRRVSLMMAIIVGITCASVFAQEAEIKKAEKRAKSAKEDIGEGYYERAQDRAEEAWRLAQRAKMLQKIKNKKSAMENAIQDAALKHRGALKEEAETYSPENYKKAGDKLQDAQKAAKKLEADLNTALNDADEKVEAAKEKYRLEAKANKAQVQRKKEAMDRRIKELEDEVAEVRKKRDAAVKKDASAQNIRKSTDQYEKVRKGNTVAIADLEGKTAEEIKKMNSDLAKKKDGLDDVVIKANETVYEKVNSQYDTITKTAGESTAASTTAVAETRRIKKEIADAKQASLRSIQEAETAYRALEKDGIDEELKDRAGKAETKIKTARTTHENAKKTSKDDYVKAQKMAEEAKTEISALSIENKKLKASKKSCGELLAKAKEKLDRAQKEGVPEAFPKEYKAIEDEYKLAQTAQNEAKYQLSCEKAESVIQKIDNLVKKFYGQQKGEAAKKLAENAISEAEKAIAQAKELNADTRVKDLYENAVSTLEKAKKQFSEKKYQEAREDANAATRLAKEAIDKLKEIKPKYYRVRLIPHRRDCLWRIAEYPFIYGDPWKWKVIFRANRSKIKDENLIFPNQVFLVPEMEGEKRQGEWIPPENDPYYTGLGRSRKVKKKQTEKKKTDDKGSVKGKSDPTS